MIQADIIVTVLPLSLAITPLLASPFLKKKKNAPAVSISQNPVHYYQGEIEH